jgi:hypothetical protein
MLSEGILNSSQTNEHANHITNTYKCLDMGSYARQYFESVDYPQTTYRRPRK